MKLKIPYLLAATVAIGSLFYFADTQGLGAAQLVTVKSVAGHELDLAKPDGKTRLVSFYAPNCPISNRDVQPFSNLQAQFATDEFEVVAIAMPYAEIQEVASHAELENIEYSIAHDADGTIGSAFPGVRFTPTTFLIDSAGEIVWRKVGAINTTETAGLITELLQPNQLATNSHQAK